MSAYDLSSCKCNSAGKKTYFFTSKHNARLCAECEHFSCVASPFLGTLGVILCMLIFFGLPFALAAYGSFGVASFLILSAISIIAIRIVELACMPIVRLNSVQKKTLENKGRKPALIILILIIVCTVLCLVSSKFWLYIH